MGKGKMHTDPYFAWKILERIDLILDTYATERAW